MPAQMPELHRSANISKKNGIIFLSFRMEFADVNITEYSSNPMADSPATETRKVTKCLNSQLTG
jgi:hypothetical protein